MPNLYEIKKTDFHSEREVETKFIIPLLDAIEYQGNEIFQEFSSRMSKPLKRPRARRFSIESL